MPSVEANNPSMDPILSIQKTKELEWIDLQEEIRASLPREDGRSRFMRKFKENPFVPIGCLFTAGVLTYGVYNFSKGRSAMSQKMMRLRVAAQGATLFAIVFGVMYKYQG